LVIAASFLRGVGKCDEQLLAEKDLRILEIVSNGVKSSLSNYLTTAPKEVFLY